MALTVTSRGTGTHNTGATTLVPGGRSATLAVGSLGVLAISLDNAGSAGSTLIAPNSWTDAKGNIWTLRINQLFDNGAASAGIEMAWYTAPITVALLTGDAGTMTWKSGSPVAKAWTWYEAIPSGSNKVAYSTGGNIAGATAANAQVVTASVLVGDAVIAGYFSENVAAVTGDSDTTNGTWTAQQTATVGTTTSGVRIATQQKVQTTTASTQTYDATVASQDRIAGYIMLHEVVDTLVTPGLATLALTAFAPTVTAASNQLVTPGLATLTLTAFAPTVTTTDNQLVVPGLATLVLAAFAPTVLTPRLVVPGLATLTLAAFAPTVLVANNQLVVPGIATLALTAFAPTVTATANQLVVPGIATLTLTAFAPTVLTPRLVTPGIATLTLTAFAPTVLTPRLVVPGIATLQLTAFAPTVTATDHKLVTPGIATLVLAAFAPTVLTTANQLVVPGLGTLTLTAFAPTVTASSTSNPVVIPGLAILFLTAFSPTVTATDKPHRRAGLARATAPSRVLRQSSRTGHSRRVL